MPNEVKYHPELDGERPPCFNPDQWRAHVRCEKQMARSGKYEPNPAGFCGECTQRYKHKMLEVGKCLHPDVVFVEDDEGALVGKRPGAVVELSDERSAPQAVVVPGDPKTDRWWKQRVNGPAYNKKYGEV